MIKLLFGKYGFWIAAALIMAALFVRGNGYKALVKVQRAKVEAARQKISQLQDANSTTAQGLRSCKSINRAIVESIAQVKAETGAQIEKLQNEIKRIKRPAPARAVTDCERATVRPSIVQKFKQAAGKD